MVLSLSELRKAESESQNQRITSMLRLREHTSSFLIQCLADREIQLIYQEHGGTNNSRAYGYNCTVVHNPHAWSHFSAINGHGWNESSNQPHDPNLKVGKVLANQHANHVQNSKINQNKLEENKRKICQLELTIQILQEENAKIKQLYIARVSNTDKNSNDSDNQQQLNSLRQQIKTISSNLDAKIQTIKSLTAVNEMLQINLSKQATISENTIRVLREENARLTQNYKLEIGKKNQTIQQLSDNITVLEEDLDFERNRYNRNDVGSKCCCTIM